MYKKKSFILVLLVIFFIAGTPASTLSQTGDDIFLSYRVDPKKQELKLFWKDANKILRSLGNVNKWVATKKQTLTFAMNAGMYKADNAPLGLFIQNGKLISALNTRKAGGNFYLKPNGVFYIDEDNNATICKTENFILKRNIKYATQSGPMLVVDGVIHPEFKQGSTNVNIRNGVGILPNNQVLFVMSKKEVNLYDFANYFKKSGCRNALFFDGFVCRTYLPEKNWIQTDGDFGVIVGVTKNN